MIFLELIKLRLLLELEMLPLLLIESLLRLVLILMIEIQQMHLLENQLITKKQILGVLSALYCLFESMIIENLLHP